MFLDLSSRNACHSSCRLCSWGRFAYNARLFLQSRCGRQWWWKQTVLCIRTQTPLAWEITCLCFILLRWRCQHIFPESRIWSYQYKIWSTKSWLLNRVIKRRTSYSNTFLRAARRAKTNGQFVCRRKKRCLSRVRSYVIGCHYQVIIMFFSWAEAIVFLGNFRFSQM